MTEESEETAIPLSLDPRSKQQEPTPIIFSHPSRGTSHVSIPGALRQVDHGPALSSAKRESFTFERGSSSRLGAPGHSGSQRSGHAFQSAAVSRSTDRTDALWAEMQATLDEVELSASEDAHAFGTGHDRKLADLRSSQIALAQAWARSEADDAFETAIHKKFQLEQGDEGRSQGGTRQFASRLEAGEVKEMAKSSDNALSESSMSGGRDGLGSQLEEETELDILLAGKRREANDQYFERVNRGVIDVVAKLEDVATAMRAVEQESKDVWNETTKI
ncbi:hypothetical protein L249_5980 [Ophiocordyceps polyrhachis-furcata BCC 54312]|uniref:Uncharacterized protein n=1 Tax=Ophiocordyceps polyrhachis-furcata BCC 54312 TaxID=1330021 RepID=A0A367LJ11_9HYPO|nr:hypothetical protein L249_5980 [Ophiocordyceps polyrhachis-furcata BCC 54312]